MLGPGVRVRVRLDRVSEYSSRELALQGILKGRKCQQLPAETPFLRVHEIERWFAP